MKNKKSKQKLFQFVVVFLSWVLLFFIAIGIAKVGIVDALFVAFFCSSLIAILAKTEGLKAFSVILIGLVLMGVVGLVQAYLIGKIVETFLGLVVASLVIVGEFMIVSKLEGEKK